MKVYQLIAELQQMPSDADAYIGWTEVNYSGTTWDTGTKVSHIEKEYGGNGKPERVVVR